MERLYERCAALDVHKQQVTVCVHVPDQAGVRSELRAEFATMTADLLGLRDWLKGLGVTHVAMEATGVYWKPVYYLLEDDFELLLVNAQHVKNVPGRKTDVKDAQWLCQLLEHGLLSSSFVPPKPIRELRDLTRYRKSLAWERARELLCTIPGVAERTAEVIIAELGPDMDRFPSHRHAASWAAICPGHDESAGKRRSGKTRKGDSWLRTALIEAAQSAAGRTRDTYLHSQYLRVKRRRGHKKAIVAVAHSILVAAYYILRDEVPYQELGGDYFVRREDQERLTQRLVRQLERLGQSVTLKPALEAR